MCNIVNCIRVHPLMDAKLEYNLAFIDSDSKKAHKIVLSHFEKKQPPKVSFSHAGKFFYAEKMGYPPPKVKIPKHIEGHHAIKQFKKGKAKSIVGKMLERQAQQSDSYSPGRIETMSQFLERANSKKEVVKKVSPLKDCYKKWEYDKLPHETAADAEARRRFDALPLLERIKQSLKEPEYNFHEQE